MARIKLRVDTGTNTLRDVSATQEVMVPGTWPAAPALDGYLKKARERSAAQLARPVATLAVPSVARGLDDNGESPLGDLVADSVLAAGRPFGVQIAFMNDGGIRSDLETGADKRVTIGQAQAVLPFGNKLVAMNLKGWQIYELLEQQWAGGRDSWRGLLQVSDGFTYQWDAKRGEGSKVVPDSVLLNGVPLQRDSSYRVMVNNFLAEGGDGFPMFANGGNRAETGILAVDALTAYLVKREEMGKPAGKAETQQRIRRLR